MPWLNEVAGVFEAWYPGQQDGNAIAALLYGQYRVSIGSNERDLAVSDAFYSHQG